jgi:small subunit ribosomal protein S30e
MGKVHGSLARNGKVRNQAPKVAKAEKTKKKVMGRAKKRQQYGKRIVGVDPNDKRRKGPNFGAGRNPKDIPK